MSSSASTSASTQFLSDQEWAEKLCPSKKPDDDSDPTANNSDPTDERWGFLEPASGNGATLDFSREHDVYKVVLDAVSGGPTVVPGAGKCLFFCLLMPH